MVLLSFNMPLVTYTPTRFEKYFFNWLIGESCAVDEIERVYEPARAKGSVLKSVFRFETPRFNLAVPPRVGRFYLEKRVHCPEGDPVLPGALNDLVEEWVGYEWGYGREQLGWFVAEARYRNLNGDLMKPHVILTWWPFSKDGVMSAKVSLNADQAFYKLSGIFTYRIPNGFLPPSVAGT